jgi:hypothetical protein
MLSADHRDKRYRKGLQDVVRAQRNVYKRPTQLTATQAISLEKHRQVRTHTHMRPCVFRDEYVYLYGDVHMLHL